MLNKLIGIAVVSSVIIANAHAGGCLALHAGALVSIHEQSGTDATQIVEAETYQDADCPAGQVAISRCNLVHVGTNGATQVCKSIIIQRGSDNPSPLTTLLPNIAGDYVKTFEVDVPDGVLSGKWK